MRAPELQISTGPFLSRGLDTRRIMFEVLLTLVPVVMAAIFYFGISALLTLVAASAGALLTEWAFGDRRGMGSLLDGSGLVTGVLLALTLPPALPLWMAFLGGAVAIGLGKSIWGGLGRNLFNPALVGRAFLQAAFPTAITTWTPTGRGLFSIPSSTFALPLMRGEVDAITTATPLGMAKFEGTVTSLGPLFMGDTAGSLGETAGVVLVVCGLWLALRQVFDWRLPVATLVATAIFGTIIHLVAPDACPGGALFMLTSGGLLFGAVYMVTDPVTTPITPRGMWIFGAGVGVLVVLIRVFGGLAEGVMYAILLMNAVTPLINRGTQPRTFGS